MKPRTAEARRLAKIAEFLKEEGVDENTIKEVREKSADRPTLSQTKDDAEAVLYTLRHPMRMIKRKCSRLSCGDTFLTNYFYDTYCSFACVKKDLADQGIIVDPTKRPEDRWGGQPPLKVRPPVLEALTRLLTGEPTLTLKQQGRFEPLEADRIERGPSPTERFAALVAAEEVPLDEVFQGIPQNLWAPEETKSEETSLDNSPASPLDEHDPFDLSDILNL